MPKERREQSAQNGKESETGERDDHAVRPAQKREDDERVNQTAGDERDDGRRKSPSSSSKVKVEPVGEVGDSGIPDLPEPVKSRLRPGFDEAPPVVRPVVETPEAPRLRKGPVIGNPTFLALNGSPNKHTGNTYTCPIQIC